MYTKFSTLFLSYNFLFHVMVLKPETQDYKIYVTLASTITTFKKLVTFFGYGYTTEL